MENNPVQQIRIRASVILIICLTSFFPITNGIVQSQVVHGALPAAQVTFVPNLTPLPLEVISAATPLPTISIEYPAYEYVHSAPPSMEDINCGYDVLYGDTEITYHLWLGNEELTIQSQDLSSQSAINAFINQADTLNQAYSDHERALDDYKHKLKLIRLEDISFAATTYSTALACVATPFTFGITAVGCGAGILALTGGVVKLG